jgi:hypothetical protein
VLVTCPQCEAAETSPLQPEYGNRCDSCRARAFAQIGAHADSFAAGRLTEDMDRICREKFPADPAAGWRMVREWGVKVDRARKAQQRGNA